MCKHTIDELQVSLLAQAVSRTNQRWSVKEAVALFSAGGLVKLNLTPRVEFFENAEQIHRRSTSESHRVEPRARFVGGTTRRVQRLVATQERRTAANDGQISAGACDSLSLSLSLCLSLSVSVGKCARMRRGGGRRKLFYRLSVKTARIGEPAILKADCLGMFRARQIVGVLAACMHGVNSESENFCADRLMELRLD
jgi:hypothetical protein